MQKLHVSEILDQGQSHKKKNISENYFPHRFRRGKLKFVCIDSILGFFWKFCVCVCVLLFPLEMAISQIHQK